MAKFIIKGGHKLSGTVKIGGNKNAVFPCLAAALLTSDEVILKNIPQIADAQISIEILKSLGAQISVEGETVTIKAENIENYILPKDLSQKLRGSILFVGGLLGRLGKAYFYHPGGDIIGKRTIQSHLDGFESLGFQVNGSDLEYSLLKLEEKPEVAIFMEESGVTATENLILTSVLGKSKVIIKNCACEPNVVDLCNMLYQMGAQIQGIGTPTLTIQGVGKLNGTRFTIGPDFIEMGTYAVAAAITRGDVTLTNCNLEGLEPITTKFKKMGVDFISHQDGTVSISCEKIYPISKLHTNIWPGFPTDLMSVVIVLATQAEGVSLLHDWMYESRFFFVDKLISMGTNITIADPHRVLVYGPTKLVARDLETPDIRAGMALVLAALFAKGTSTINRAELIERGYEDVAGKLSNLGARIERAED